MKNELIIVTVSLGNDGAERVLTLLANELIKDQYDVTIIQTKPGTYGNSYSFDKRIKVHDFSYHGEGGVLRYFSEAKQLRAFLKNKKNATLIAFLSQSMFVSVIAKIGLKNKLVVSERNDPRRCPAKRIQRIVRDICFYFADACIFQTETVKHMFSKSIQKKSVVIPNPVNPALPDPFSGERQHRIVTACRLHPQKNLEMLLEAFSHFHKSFPDYTLDIYGTGVLEEKLKNYAATLDVSDSVVFHGFVTNLYAQIRTAMMYVCSSDYEGISNSIIEAMALGIPTIATDCPIGGSSMLIQNGENGLLVPVGDFEQMLQAMLKVAGSKELADHLSENAVKVRKTYDIDGIMKQWEQVL